MDEARLDAAREDARAALLAAVEAADPRDLVADHVEAGSGGLEVAGVDVDPGRCRFAALGKAAPATAQALAEAAPGVGGVCAAPEALLDGVEVPDGWEAIPGGHPLPTEGSLRAGEALLGEAEAVPEDGALVVGVSGGGSACAEAPTVPLDDLRAVTADLLAAGVAVADLNAVRRALSDLKGGGLVEDCDGRVVGLVLSDVVGDALRDVASGPTVPTPRDPARARAVLREAGLWEATPSSVRDALAGETDGSREPDREGGVVNRLVGGNGDALRGAAEALRDRGWSARVREEPVVGEAREAGRALAEAGLAARAKGRERWALVVGGEPTVAVRGDGDGGPCQELAAAAAGAVAGEEVVVAAASTDGRDGPTGAAGGIVDGRTLGRGREGSLEAALGENDAGAWLEEVGGRFRTGPTGTNVNDVVVVLVP